MSTASPTGDMNAQPPSKFIPPDFDGLPDELKQKKNWLGWRYLPPRSKGGKWRKVPFQPNGKQASSTDPSTWSTFDDCRAAYANGGFSGVGFVFDGQPDENGLVYAGVDFDSKALQGEKAIHAAEWVDRLGSYVETSVSGTGAHVIVKAKPLPRGISHGGIELYTTGRYFAMTGHTEGAPQPIIPAPSEFAALAKELQAARGADQSNPSKATNVIPFELPEWAYNPPPSAFAYLQYETFADDRDNVSIEEIRSAVAAIPPAAIADENEWMALARGLAHHVSIGEADAEEFWTILDTASRQAPRYNEQDNRDRFHRYIREAAGHPKPITIGTVLHMAFQHGWQRPSSPVNSPVANSTTSASAWSPAGLTVSFSSIPHRQWLYGTYLIRGEITMLAAPGGAGKTAEAMAWSVEVATGRELLGEKLWRSDDQRVLYINGEDSGTEIRRRLFAFAQLHGLSEQDLARLHVAGADDGRVQAMSFLHMNEKGATNLNKAGFAVLECALQELRPDLLVLDPLVVFCGGGNMNDNAVMSLVMRELKALAVQHDCALLVVHHTRKGRTFDDAAGDPERISGAAAIVNLARRALMPVSMSETEAKEYQEVLPSDRPRFFKLVDAKSNLAPLSVEAPWFELVNVELPNAEPPIYPNGDRVQAVRRAQLSRLKAAASLGAQERAIRFELMKLVDQGLIVDGEQVPYSPNSTGNNKKRAILDDAMAAVERATPDREWLRRDLRATVERELEALKQDGWVKVEKIATGRFRRSHGLQAAWERTPWAKERENLRQHGGPTVRTEQEQQELDRSDLNKCLDDLLTPDGQSVNDTVNQ
jgi:hypothetical protein